MRAFDARRGTDLGHFMCQYAVVVETRPNVKLATQGGELEKCLGPRVVVQPRHYEHSLGKRFFNTLKESSNLLQLKRNVLFKKLKKKENSQIISIKIVN